MEMLKRSPITWALIIINAIVWILVEITGGSEDVNHMIMWGAQYAPLVRDSGEYYRLFTCMFLHFGLSHITNNMLILYFVGSILEQAVGHVRFLIIYLGGGLGASFISHYMDLKTGNYAAAAGASGAVFAIIGGLIWALILYKGKMGGITMRQILFMAALSLYHGFSSTGVDNSAHVGGIVCGFIIALLVYHRRRPIKQPISYY